MKQREFEKLIAKYPELKTHFQMVIMKDGTVYWKRKHPWSRDRTLMPEPARESALLLGETAYKNFGKKGFVEGVPVVAYLNRKKLQGKKFTIPKWERIALELKEQLRAIGRVVEEVKVRA